MSAYRVGVGNGAAKPVEAPGALIIIRDIQGGSAGDGSAAICKGFATMLASVSA